MICVCHRQDTGFLPHPSPQHTPPILKNSLILVTWEELEGKGSDVPPTDMAEDKAESTANMAVIMLTMCQAMKPSCENGTRASFCTLHNKASKFIQVLHHLHLFLL